MEQSKAKTAALELLGQYELFYKGGNLIIPTRDLAQNGEASILAKALSIIADYEVRFHNLRFGQGKRVETLASSVLCDALEKNRIKPVFLKESVSR